MTARVIPLTQGVIMLVDQEDFWYLQAFDWYAQCSGARRWVAVRQRKTSSGKSTTVCAHREVLPNCGELDHINHYPLETKIVDNRKLNLRPATRSQNGMNSRKRSNSTSTFKGVCWNTCRSTWTSHIQVNGKTKRIGSFSSEIEAAMAYDRAAYSLFGEFARGNFPRETYATEFQR